MKITTNRIKKSKISYSKNGVSQTGNNTHPFIPSLNLQLLSCFFLLRHFRISDSAGHIRNADVSGHSEFGCPRRRNVVVWGVALGCAHSHGFFNNLETEILVGFVVVAAEDERRRGTAAKMGIAVILYCLRFELLFAPHCLLLQLQSGRMKTLITVDCLILINTSKRTEFEN